MIFRLSVLVCFAALTGGETFRAQEAAAEGLIQKPIQEQRNFRFIIGMDTLRRFDAFGWEPNPLRVYFSPKGAGD